MIPFQQYKGKHLGQDHLRYVVFSGAAPKRHVDCVRFQSLLKMQLEWGMVNVLINCIDVC